jgi:hypothetical protein
MSGVKSPSRQHILPLAGVEGYVKALTQEFWQGMASLLYMVVHVMAEGAVASCGPVPMHLRLVRCGSGMSRVGHGKCKGNLTVLRR